MAIALKEMKKMREQAVKDVEKEFLEPSFKYLVKNGLENTSVRDLCKEMGISYGSIYYWFEGKDDIYISVVKYGTGKVAKKLFEMAFDKMQNPKLFFDTFLEEIDKYKMELRLIFQVTTSPIYGDRMRDKAEDFKSVYEKHIIKLAQIVGCEPKDMEPIIYMLISILVDYVVWEDYEVSKLQLKFLYNIMSSKTK